MGRHVLNALLDSERKVHLSLRPSSKREDWPDRVKIFQGDIRDAKAVKEAMNGCQEVIHTAVFMIVWVKDKRIYEEVNLGGLKNAVMAAKEIGIKKFLHVSCFIALGPTGGMKKSLEWLRRMEL